MPKSSERIHIDNLGWLLGSLVLACRLVCGGVGTKPVEQRRLSSRIQITILKDSNLIMSMIRRPRPL